MSKILAFSSKEVEEKLGGLTSFGGIRPQPEDVQKALNEMTPVWKKRSELEKDPNYRQPIVYFIIQRVEGLTFTEDVLLYKRKGGGESRLEGKYSIGFGGHVEQGDEGESITETLHNAYLRELEEELPGLDIFFEEIFGVHWTNENEVDEVHLAIFMNVATNTKIGDIELTEGTLIGYIPETTLNNMIKSQQGANSSMFEQWTIDVTTNHPL